MKDAPSNSDDFVDVRDIIARFEELEDERQPLLDAQEEANAGTLEDRTAAAAALQQWTQANGEEFKLFGDLLAELKGMGGDEQWRGDWYPVTLIRDSYFEDYARELASDIGAVKDDAGWPNRCIDWKQAAEELQMDYSTVDFDGVTYWTR